MIAARIISPHSKLATCRWWYDTTLVEQFKVDNSSVDELYAAMDWLLKRQSRIKNKLAHRDFKNAELMLYDLTSSYFEGCTCPLARHCYNRDLKKGKLQVNYRRLCDVRGRPVAVSVHEGNVSDTQTLLAEIERLQKRFGVKRLVIVGDRGMITQTKINVLRELIGIDWISALKSGAIRKLIRNQALQTERFNEVNLFEIIHPGYPGERLVAFRNGRLAQCRTQTRESLLQATAEAELAAIRTRVAGASLTGRAEIGVRIGQDIQRYKMKKHFQHEITDTSFSFWRT